jgi:hypothetical protein
MQNKPSHSSCNKNITTSLEQCQLKTFLRNMRSKGARELPEEENRLGQETRTAQESLAHLRHRAKDN